jgi:hypothetical protein
MARQTGTADPIAGEYLMWQASGGRFQVQMHRDAIDGLARDVIERSAGLPVEVGGLLLGHATRGDRPVVWIERYQRIECEHRSGPYFILDRTEHAALERTATGLAGDLNVVGFYRSHLRPGFQLEAPDFELTDRYFRDPEDLFLLIRPLEKPDNPTDLLAQFFLHDRAGDAAEIRPADPPFPFRGRLVAMAPEDGEEGTRKTLAGLPLPEALTRAKPLRRLVPDFAPAGEPVRPAPEFFREDWSALPPAARATEDLPDGPGFLQRRWPSLAAVALVAGGITVFLQQNASRAPAAPAQVEGTSAARPLGLHVDPAGQYWRIAWNPSATALKGARSVQLFVNGGDDQNRIELTAKDLESGTYRYPAAGSDVASDVTFRLEVTDSDGHLSAESFRLVKTTEPAAPRPAVNPSVNQDAAKTATPVVLERVPPVVPVSLRPRIKGTVGVEVKVRVDEEGRVVSATPVGKPHSGVESFLTERAVEAARKWRYKRGAPGTEIIRFTFKK